MISFFGKKRLLIREITDISLSLKHLWHHTLGFSIRCEM